MARRRDLMTSITTASCSNTNTVKITVPYYPYAHCYQGSGSGWINLSEVSSIESRSCAVTVR
jgi:hypothetical protein